MLLAFSVNAQVSNYAKLVKGHQPLSRYIAQAVAKSYETSVLMWETDPDSGVRMSAQFSGVVVSKEGVILSAAHVVMPGKTYKVMFPNGRECIAKGLGRISIPPTRMLPDAAMLQITEKGSWPFAQMGWSSALTVSTPCLSIAYPESLEQRKPTVRFGRITLLKNKYGFLQSSCVMEPGDSGGPLFDLLGRVIAIHSGIEVPECVNYEVPIDTYRKYWNALSKPEDYQELPDSLTVSSDTLTNFMRSIPSFQDINKEINLNVKLFSSSCLKIKSRIDGKEQSLLATIVPAKDLALKPATAHRTLLLSKSSMVGDKPEIILPDGKTIKASVIARSRRNDLVLLLTDYPTGKAIKFDWLQRGAISLDRLGAILISPIPDSAAKTGVLGSLLLDLPNNTSFGYLDATTGIKDERLVLTSVPPNSAAKISGLETGDVIERVDGNIVEDQLDFIKALQKYNAGDTTMLKIIRDSKVYTKPVVLGYPPQKAAQHPAEMFAGGKSLRRDGFDQVFVHDSGLKANQCGGPVFDAEGYFIGINIARISRTGTVVIPASTVLNFINNSLRFFSR